MIPRLASDGKVLKENPENRCNSVSFVVSPYKCEIICHKPASHKLRKEEFLYVRTGIRGKQSVAMAPEHRAKTMGGVDVFATPALVALAEKTCWMSVADALDENCGSVSAKLGAGAHRPTRGCWPSPARRADRCGRPQAGVQNPVRPAERPVGGVPRALCGQRRKSCRQGRGAEGLRRFFSAGSMGGGSAASSCCSARPGLPAMRAACFAGTEQLSVIAL